MIINCAHQKMMPIEQLVEHPSNANRHPEKQIEMLAKIMNYQGWRHPIVVSNLSGYIVAGHGRLAAAKKLGWTECPVDTQDFEDKIQEVAFLFSDNKIAELAEHDDEMFKLEALNLQLDVNGFDLDLLGVPDLDLSMPTAEQNEMEDSVPEVTESISKLGDLYELGGHRLLCGDSTDKATVEMLMGGEKADMVFTDPPYGISYQSNMRTKSKKFDVIDNDETFLSEWVNVLPISSTGWVFVWTTWKVLEKWIEITKPIGVMTNLIVWDKGGGGIGDLSKTFSTDHELALVFNRGAEITGKRLGSVWSVGKDKAIEYIHPTQKPVELGQIAIENCTRSNAGVLDLFGGSGSTLIACEKTKRKCFMMELDPHYVDVIVTRWCKYANQTKIKRNGETVDWVIK